MDIIGEPLMSRLGILLAAVLFSTVLETNAHIPLEEGTYVSRGEITNRTALNLTEVEVYGDHFTLAWAPVDRSWNISEVRSYRLTIKLVDPASNIEQVVTITHWDTSTYTFRNVAPENEYQIHLRASRCHDLPDVVSNTVTIRPGKDFSPRKLFLLSIVMILWFIAITHFLRTWHKKMTLRPSIEMTSTSDPGSPYNITQPYNYKHTRRSNSLAPELGHQTSGSSLQLPNKSYLSRSFNDLHTVIPEDSPMLNEGCIDVPSSSGFAYTRT